VGIVTDVIAAVCAAINAGLPGSAAAPWTGNLPDLTGQGVALPALRVRFLGAQMEDQRMTSVTVRDRMTIQVVAMDLDAEPGTGWTPAACAELLIAVEPLLRDLIISDGRLIPQAIVDVLPADIRGAAGYGLNVQWERYRRG